MIPIHNLYYLLCYAWDSFEEAGTVDVWELEGFRRVEELLGTILARGVARLARRGLHRSYVPFEEELAGLRGKVELGESIRRLSTIRQRLVCSFEELSFDVLHNQILAATLGMLSRHRTLDRTVRQEVRRASSRMPGVTPVPLSRQVFGRVQLDRNRRAYRFLLNVCRLLHDVRSVDPSSGQSRFAEIDVQRLTMWRVFEQFVTRFYRREQHAYRVHGQARVEWWQLRTRGPLSEGRVPVMKPDVMLLGPERRIILDAKYYRDGGLPDEVNAKLHAGHLYQLFAYIMNLERAGAAGPAHEGILLYPTVGDETQVEFMTHGHRFQARSVDLSRPWREIHDAMLGVLSQ